MFYSDVSARLCAPPILAIEEILLFRWTLPSPTSRTTSNSFGDRANFSFVPDSEWPPELSAFPLSRCSTGRKTDFSYLSPARVCRSNMDMPVSYAFNSSAESAASLHYPSLRLFNVIPNSSSTPLENFISISPWASPASLPDGAAGFSAVCWFALRDLHNGLAAAGDGDVPIGLLHTALGGTAIQQWMSPEAKMACPPPTVGPNYSYSGLYNAMVAPLVRGPKMAIGGIIWCVARMHPPTSSRSA